MRTQTSRRLSRFLLTLASALVLSLSGCQTTAPGVYSNAYKLTDAEVMAILNQAEAAASAQPSLLRVNDAGQKQTTRMHIIVMNRGARTVGRRSMDDAWHGSLSIATMKAYTAMCFSSDQNALTTRSLGTLTQPGGPLWNIGNSNRGMFQPGLIEFPGGVPLYKNGVLVGGIGVCGDGVDEDEAVALAGAQGFDAPQVIRIDTVTVGKVPYTK